MICSDGGPRACQRAVSQKEKTNTIFKHIYTESRKMALMNPLRAGIRRHRCRNRHVDTAGQGERVGWIGSAALTYTHTAMHTVDS